MAIANRTFRSSMLLSTAMAALVAVPGVAHAQLVGTGDLDLDSAFDPDGNGGANGAGSGVVIDVADDLAIPNRTNITVKVPVVVANWNRFNVRTGTVLDVSHSLVDPSAKATLVNRVIGNDPSRIAGQINSRNVNFWLINQNGILFGDGANITMSGASFFASTLDVAAKNADPAMVAALFQTGADLDFSFGGTAPIRTAPQNVSFVSDGSMMFLSQQLTLNADFTSGSGIAFVTASDVDVTFNPGSPLSYVVQAGTTVARGQTISGTVTGDTVDFHMMTAAGVTDAVLRVDAMVNATQAVPTASGIRLIAGGDSLVNATINGAFGGTGTVDIDVNGNLRATNSIAGSAVDIDVLGSARLADLAASAGGIDVAATSIVAGNVAATGGDINLLSQGALNLVDVTATTGAVRLEALGGNLVADDVRASGDILFQTSNTARAIFGSLVSDTGQVAVDGLVPSVLTVARETRGAAVALFAVNQLTLGDVTATAGEVSLGSSLASVVAGNVTSTGGNIEIDAATTIRAGALTANGGDALLTAASNITTASITASTLLAAGGMIGVSSFDGNLNLGVLDADTDIALDTVGRVTTGAIDARGALVIGGTAIPNGVNLTGDVRARSIQIETDGNLAAMDLFATRGTVDITALNILAGDIQANRGDVSLLASNNITTGSITTNPVDSANGAIDVFSIAGGRLLLGDLTAGLGIALNTSGSITAGSVTARGGALSVGGLRLPNAVTFTGNASGESISIDVLGAFRGAGLTARAGDVLVNATAITAGDIRATGGDVLLQAAPGAVTTGNVTALTVAGVGGAIDIASTGNGALTLGNLLADQGIVLSTSGAVAAGAVTARGGAFTTRGPLTASSVTFTGNVRALSIDILTSGALVGQNFAATDGGVLLEANAITADAVSSTGGDVRLLAAGAITTGRVSATSAAGIGGAIDIDSTAGGNLVLGDLSADLGITLDTMGSITAGSATARGGALVVGGASDPASVSFTGNARAQSITIDTTGAFTAFDLAATAGGITVDAASISAGALSATGGDIDLDAAGNITTASLRSSDAIDVVSTAGGALDLGTLTAGLGITLDTTGTITTAAITAGGALVVGGASDPASVTFTGNARAKSITIDTTGAFTAQGLTSTAGAIIVDAGSISAGALSATGGDVDLLAVGDITTASIRSSGAIDVDSTGSAGTGFSLNLGALIAGQDITLDANGTITAAGITSSGGSLLIGQGLLPDAVTITGDVSANSITIDTSGALSGVDMTARAGTIDLNAGSIMVDALNAFSGDVLLLSQGDALTGALSATGAIDADSITGSLETGALDAGLGITLDAAVDITVGGSINADGTLVVGGASSPDSVTFMGDARASSITVTTPGAFEAASRDSEGAPVARFALTSTNGAVTIDAGSILAGQVGATGGDVDLEAVGDILTTSIRATGDIAVLSTGTGMGAGDLDLGGLTAGGNIMLDANGNIDAGRIAAEFGALTVGGASSPTNVTFVGDALAQSIAITTTGVLTALDLTATAGSLLVDAGAIDADALSATGGNVDLLAVGDILTESINSSDAIIVESTDAGALDLGMLSAGLGITLDTDDSIKTGSILAGNALLVGTLREATTVDFTGSATAASITVIASDAFTALDLTTIDGAIIVDAGSIAVRTLRATGGDVDLLAGGDIATMGITTTGAIDVDSIGTGEDEGDLDLGNLTAALAITLDANGAIRAGRVGTTGGSLTVGSTSSADSVNFTSNVSARSIAVTSTGEVLIGERMMDGMVERANMSSTAGGIMITSGSIIAGRLSATGGNVNLLTTGGINTTSIGATGAITARSSGGGVLDLGALTAGLDVTLNTTGSLTTAAIITDGALIIGNMLEPSSVTITDSVSADSITIDASGAFTSQGLTATAGGVDIDAGSISTGVISATGGNVRLLALGNIATGAISALRAGGVGGMIDIDSTGTGESAGMLNLGALLADLGITLDTQGAIATGAITARNGAVAANGRMITIDGATSATGGDVRLAAIGSITTGAITAARAGGGGGAIDVDSTGGGAILLGALDATQGITLDSTGSIATRSGAMIDADGDLVVGGTLRASSVTFGGSAEAANITVDTSGLFTASGMSVGTGTIDIEASNVALTGTVEADNVILTSFNNGSIGLGTAAGTLSLSDAELDLIEADSLLINARTGNIGIAGATFDSEAGRNSVTLATTGMIAITGDLSGTGAARTFRLGGDMNGIGVATRITANIDMATIDLGTATLDLRGTDIVFGQQMLIDDVEGLPVADLVAQFVANAESLLYTPRGLGATRLANPTYLTAGRLTVTYGGSALFQNAASRAGGNAFEGVNLGSAANPPATPALSLNPLTTPVVVDRQIVDGNVFALFGTINGSTGPAAALGGGSVISVNDEVLAPASRVNGCIIGSAEGCVTTIVGNFVLSVPREVVSPIVAEEGLLVPFDPLVGANNESLFSDAASASADDEDCKQRDATGACVGN